MNNPQNPSEILSGDLYDDEAEFTLEEICRSCTVEVDHVIEFVQEGVIEPRGEVYERWRFKISSIRRVKTAVRLQRDLGVNLAGAALALDLLDRIAELEK